jgi:uracil-DNA glycosylase family 4
LAVPDLVHACVSGARAAPPAASGAPPASGAPDSLAALTAEIVDCRACPRLVAWREASAANPPARYRGETYHARPIPGFGDAGAGILLLGLAPAKDGGNRTGRVFTGDRSGDFLFAALHRVGLANQPTSTSRDDGLQLRGAYVAAAVRCAPPDNTPLPDERDRCAPYLHREMVLLGELRVIVALGAFAWRAALQAVEATSGALPRPLPRFRHGATAPAGPYTLFGAYHPSQQNTFTGRLTPAMFDDVLRRAGELATRAQA